MRGWRLCLACGPSWRRTRRAVARPEMRLHGQAAVCCSRGGERTWHPTFPFATTITHVKPSAPLMAQAARVACSACLLLWESCLHPSAAVHNCGGLPRWPGHRQQPNLLPWRVSHAYIGPHFTHHQKDLKLPIDALAAATAASLILNRVNSRSWRRKSAEGAWPPPSGTAGRSAGASSPM